MLLALFQLATVAFSPAQFLKAQFEMRGRFWRSAMRVEKVKRLGDESLSATIRRLLATVPTATGHLRDSGCEALTLRLFCLADNVRQPPARSTCFGTGVSQ